MPSKSGRCPHSAKQNRVGYMVQTKKQSFWCTSSVLGSLFVVAGEGFFCCFLIYTVTCCRTFEVCSWSPPSGDPGTGFAGCMKYVLFLLFTRVLLGYGVMVYLEGKRVPAAAALGIHLI